MVTIINKSDFEAKLNKVYNGAVTPLNTYINDRCSMLFNCDKCGVEFFGKASHIVGKDHQRHICTMPYGDQNGERLFSVGHRLRIKKKSKDMSKRFYEMVIEDYTYQQIAQEMQINPNIVKDYFKDEGLIK